MISVNQSNKEALAAILIWLMSDPFFGLVYCLYLFIFSVLPHMVPDTVLTCLSYPAFLKKLNKYKSANEVSLKIVLWVRSIFSSFNAYSAINSWFSQCILWVEKMTALSPASPQTAGRVRSHQQSWVSDSRCLSDIWGQQLRAALCSHCLSVIVFFGGCQDLSCIFLNITVTF